MRRRGPSGRKETVVHAPSVVRLRGVFVPFLLAFLFTLPALGDKPECAKGGNVPNFSVNCADQFAWQKFFEVNAGKVPAFLTYSSDPDTFPCPPADLETC